MIHTEHFGKTDKSYEIRHDNNGNAIHVFIKDGEAIIFPTIRDLIDRVIFGMDIERFYLDEVDLDKLYDSDKYNYYELKEIAKSL